jgi:hypothetical protein
MTCSTDGLSFPQQSLFSPPCVLEVLDRPTRAKPPHVWNNTISTMIRMQLDEGYRRRQRNEEEGQCSGFVTRVKLRKEGGKMEFTQATNN